MPESTARVAATYVHLLFEYLRLQGIEPTAVIGHPPAEDEHFVPLGPWRRMLEQVEALEGREALGLRVAAGIEARHFGVVGYAALACPTLGQALQRLERHHAAVYDVNPATVSLLPSGDVCIEWGVARGKPGRLVDETAIASLVQLTRDMTGRNIAIRQVCFVNERPLDLNPYRDYFQGEVRFSEPVTRLVIDAACMTLPLRKSDPALLAIMDQAAEKLLERVADVPAEVDAIRRDLIALIREGRPALDRLAEVRAVSVRSLQRRLAEHGWKFQDLLDQTRRHLAEGYLREPGLDLAEIALLLGFSEQSAFTRAFRLWTGQPPSQWRKAVQRPPSA